jgi:hypothetical protein
MVRLDDAIWVVNAAGGLGPAGWLGSAALEPSQTFYSPLHDYQLGPPDLDPAVAARVRTIQGRTAILAQTPIATHTNILASEKSRLFTNDDWVAVVGQVASVDAIITLHHPFFNDGRLAVFAFWWESVEGKEDLELEEAVAFTSAYLLAQDGYVGVITSTNDPAVIEQYTINQQLVRTPWDMLTDLGRQDMVGP